MQKHIQVLTHTILTAVLLFLPTVILADNTATTFITTDEATKMYSDITMATVSVHDPSIVYCSSTKTYYIFGSHLATAKTKDLQNWSSVSFTWSAVDNEGNITENVTYNEAFHYNQTKEISINGQTVAFGNFDAAAWNCAIPTTDDDGNEVEWTIDGNMWAPDVIYNPTMDKWCQYLSLNGYNWNSCIILLTADNIEGPYTYQGPVVYTGFINETNENISYHLTDLELVIGEQESLPTRYKQDSSWGSYWPHAIDPCVFYDEDSTLWMSYGSWSGGIFMLQLNKETGLRDYDVTYDSDYDTKKTALTTDAYFGIKIAGGCYVSGEGSYIEHIGNYYYLFLSYGALDPNGGYEMRVFRSTEPTGPYVDPSGTSAIFTSWVLNYGLNSDTRGEKLLGSYNNWGFMTVGECAQGHNSVLAAEDGNIYLVYHTKFNDGTAGHLVRVHQLFVNENGWLVAAPFEYNGENNNEINILDKEIDIPGTYYVMFHNYRLDHSNYEEMTPSVISINQDGTVSGDYTGTWATIDDKYFNIKLGSYTYKGVIVEQQMELTTIKAIAFTAANSSGLNVWGYRMEDQYALAYTMNNNTMPVKNNQNISTNVDLYGNINAWNTVNVAWTSDTPDIISSTGQYNPSGLTENVPVELSVTLSCGDYYWSQSYNVTAQAEYTPSGDWLTGLMAYYDYNELPATNAYDESQTARLLGQNSNDKPTLADDSIRNGSVLHQYYGAYGSSSYSRITNPLYNTEIDGFTISMWVKRNDDDLWDAIWSFYQSNLSTRLYLTGNAYIGFNNGTDWFDINYPTTIETDYISEGEWKLVTLITSRQSGITLYVDGKKRSLTFSGSTDEDDFDYNLIIDFVQNCKYFYTGYGSFWGSADVYIDDLLIYNLALEAKDARGLNTVSNRVTDFSPSSESTGISTITAHNKHTTKANGIYDLAGRRITSLKKGVYIINGEKVIIP